MYTRIIILKSSESVLSNMFCTSRQISFGGRGCDGFGSRVFFRISSLIHSERISLLSILLPAVSCDLLRTPLSCLEFSLVFSSVCSLSHCVYVWPGFVLINPCILFGLPSWLSDCSPGPDRLLLPAPHVPLFCCSVNFSWLFSVILFSQSITSCKLMSRLQHPVCTFGQWLRCLAWNALLLDHVHRMR